MHPTQHSTIRHPNAPRPERTAERLVLMMAQGLQDLAMKSHGLHIAPRPIKLAEPELSHETREAISRCIHRAQARKFTGTPTTNEAA